MEYMNAQTNNRHKFKSQDLIDSLVGFVLLFWWRLHSWYGGFFGAKRECTGASHAKCALRQKLLHCNFHDNTTSACLVATNHDQQRGNTS